MVRVVNPSSKAAPYTRETLDRMRLMTLAGKGIHAIADVIGWDAERVRITGARHEIKLIDDGPQAEVSPPKRQPEIITEEPKRVYRRFVTDAREKYLTVAISKAAREKLNALSEQRGFSAGGMAGAVLDYILRHDQAEEYLDAYTRERQK